MIYRFEISRLRPADPGRQIQKSTYASYCLCIKYLYKLVGMYQTRACSSAGGWRQINPRRVSTNDD